MIMKRALLKLWRGIILIPHWILDSVFLGIDKKILFGQGISG